MKVIIDQPSEIRQLLLQSRTIKSPDRYAQVSGSEVYLPKPFHGMSINFESNGRTFGAWCWINCGEFIPRKSIVPKFGTSYRNRWVSLGPNNKGYLTTIDGSARLISCKHYVDSDDGRNMFRISLGKNGARPLPLGREVHFNQHVFAFQAVIQTSIDTFLERAGEIKRSWGTEATHDAYFSLSDLYVGQQE